MDQDKTGKFIASLRKEKNMTQEQFAEALGVNSRSVSRWETGRCMPDLSLIEAVSDQLGISVSEFLHGSRMNKEEIVSVQDSISTIIEISEKEKKVKAKKLNSHFVLGMMCLVIILLNHQFGFLSFVFRENVDDFVAGALTGLTLFFEFIGFYNNNHDVTFSQQKRDFFSGKRSLL